MISFVVPAYNEELLIPRTLSVLDGVANSLGEPYEIVVVDDGSTDHTAAISARCGARVIRVNHRQISATRNSGARAARGDKLVFVDADTLVTEAALQAAIRAMQEGAAGGGCAIRFDGRLPLWVRMVQDLFIVTLRWARFAGGCFLFCTRDAFEAVGGFSERIYGGEEIIMSRALRKHGRFVILREQVTTSGRKLRAYSGLEILAVFGGLLLQGRQAVRGRRGMDLWYGERREDPGAPTHLNHLTDPDVPADGPTSEL